MRWIFAVSVRRAGSRRGNGFAPVECDGSYSGCKIVTVHNERRLGLNGDISAPGNGFFRCVYAYRHFLTIRILIRVIKYTAAIEAVSLIEL